MITVPPLAKYKKMYTVSNEFLHDQIENVNVAAVGEISNLAR